MSGTREGALKRIENLKRKHPKDWLKKNALNAAKHSKGGGFASDKVGRDGLTGRQRAAVSGKKGGHVSSGNFKNDPQRAKRLAQEYWHKKKETTDEDSKVSP